MRVERVNPNPRRLFNMAGQEMDYFMPVICTDRGGHKRIRLTTARREMDGSHGMGHALVHFAPPMRDAEPGTQGISRESYNIICPKCSRHIQLKSEKWWKLVDDCARVELPELDISLLRF